MKIDTLPSHGWAVECADRSTGQHSDYFYHDCDQADFVDATETQVIGFQYVPRSWGLEVADIFHLVCRCGAEVLLIGNTDIVRTYEFEPHPYSVIPPLCPTCYGHRTWDFDMAEPDGERFAWCPTCAVATNESELPLS